MYMNTESTIITIMTMTMNADAAMITTTIMSTIITITTMSADAIMITTTIMSIIITITTMNVDAVMTMNMNIITTTTMNVDAAMIIITIMQMRYLQAGAKRLRISLQERRLRKC